MSALPRGLVRTAHGASAAPRVRWDSPPALSINIIVDSNGDLVGGIPAAPDFIMQGKVAGTSYDGILLTGEIAEFGFRDSDTTTDDYDFRFTPTSGLLLPLFGGSDIGVILRSPGSNFVADFNQDISGGANGNVGPIDPILEPQLSSLSGTIFSDLDNNGILNGSDSPIEDVFVALTGTDSGGNPVNLTTTTGPDGMYHFVDLNPSDGTGYTITETQPYPPYLDGKDTLGTLGGNPSVNDTFSQIIVPAGTDGVSYDFGELLPASLSGFVYHDANDNGARDDGGGSAITGVLVHLTGVDDLAHAVSLTTSTDSFGHYSFDELRPSGSAGYTISEDQPATHLDGQDTAGTGVTSLGQSNDSFNVLVEASDTGIDWNFGELLAASVGDFVWEDANGNGIQEALEPGIAGVRVELWRDDDLTPDNGSAGKALALPFTTTDSTGFYGFSGIAPDNYYVRFFRPSAYRYTPINQGGDDTIDSDPTQIGNTTQAVTSVFTPPAERTICLGMPDFISRVHRQLRLG